MNVDDSYRYPAGLLDWAGNRVGGVKRLFHSSSGRPSGKVIQTALLDRLTNWARALACADSHAPRIILLVGGPGNGKTEAVEHSIEALDSAFGAHGRLLASAAEQFGTSKNAAQRLVVLPINSSNTQMTTVAIVQDASGGAGAELPPPAELVRDLEKFAIHDAGAIYLACVNRGVLDDALVYATENKRYDAAQLVEQIIKSVSISPGAPSCWPLAGYPSVGVWPMDVESLVDSRSRDDSASAASQLLDLATDLARWPSSGTCVAGDRCPFCTNRKLLSQELPRSSLLEILRWYELATGKRWTFRDLFSLVSYLLAGVPSRDGGDSGDPCQWAADLTALAARAVAKPDSRRLAAPFLLAAAQYQHALFMTWPREGVRALRRDLQDLQLDSHPALMGFYFFLAKRPELSLAASLQAQLFDLCAVLDPAVADSDLEVRVSSQTVIRFRDLDIRFSRSVGEGLSFIRKFQCLTAIEVDVLQRLDEADRRLGERDAVTRKPATAEKLQLLLRDFACRFVRRSVGVRAAVVRDKQTLADFRRVVEGDPTLLHTAAKQVEGLLNERERFVVALNTTFGESLPPEPRRAILATTKQKVRPWPVPGEDRPDPSLRFLGIGSSESVQSIALTFELFRSVRELRQGLIPASLPRSVVALLDTTRARLAGKIVRDEASLDGAEIRIAARDDVILREMESFVVVSREASREL
jgi:hypothetical protein